MTTVEIKAAWDGPLEPDWRRLLESAAKELRIAADQTTPQGALNQSQAASMQRKFSLREEGGTLVRSHRFRILFSAMEIQWTNKKRYAKIQDVGGYIPPYDITQRKGGRYRQGVRNTGLNKKGQETGRRTSLGTTGGSRVMVAFVAGGWKFFTKRKGFYLRGQDYTGRAIDKHVKHVKVRWEQGQRINIGFERGNR